LSHNARDARLIAPSTRELPLNADVLTVRDLAEREHVAPCTVRTWIYEGEAPRHYRVGKRSYRFRLADVEAWERSRENDPDLSSKYGDWDFSPLLSTPGAA
jgi:excisionase family DNA binding protein